MRRINRQSSKGFTLVEVLVALSVLALGLAGVAKLTQTGYRHVATSDKYQQASYLAHGHLNSLAKTSVAAGYQTGFYSAASDAPPRFRWELLLSPVAPESLASAALSDKVEALRADLTVWIDKDTRSLDFHTLLLSNKPGLEQHVPESPTQPSAALARPL